VAVRLPRAPTFRHADALAGTPVGSGLLQPLSLGI
jgi:hypothetical protein